MQQNSYDGYYQIVSKHSGKVLDVQAGSTDNGAEIIQYHSTGADNQLWQLVPGSGNYVEVVTGENVNGNPLWGHSEQGHYFWLGATDHPNG